MLTTSRTGERVYRDDIAISRHWSHSLSPSLPRNVSPNCKVCKPPCQATIYCGDKPIIINNALHFLHSVTCNETCRESGSIKDNGLFLLEFIRLISHIYMYLNIINSALSKTQTTCHPILAWLGSRGPWSTSRRPSSPRPPPCSR